MGQLCLSSVPALGTLFSSQTHGGVNPLPLPPARKKTRARGKKSWNYSFFCCLLKPIIKFKK